jgi:uncharacterized protein YoxC
MKRVRKRLDVASIVQEAKRLAEDIRSKQQKHWGDLMSHVSDMARNWADVHVAILTLRDRVDALSASNRILAESLLESNRALCTALRVLSGEVKGGQ